MQPGVGADGPRGRPVLLHELQPLQRAGVRRRFEPVGEDPSPHAQVPPLPEPGGEWREAHISGGGGEEQAQRAQELEAVDAAGVWDPVGGDREDAAAAVQSVRRD